MNKRIFLVYGLLLVLVIISLIAVIHGFFRPALKTRHLANGQQQIVLLAADDHPSDYPTVRAIRYMAKRLATISHQQMVIQVYPGAQLGSEQDVLEQTLFGALDIARLSANALNHIDDDTTLLSLPYVFKTEKSMHKVLDGPVGREILHSFTAVGYMGLAFYDSGVRSFYNTKKPLYHPSDLAGLKIRVQASDVVVAMVRALGGNATTMDFGEVFNALKLGDIDGAENNIPSFYSTKHFTVAKYFSRDQHAMVPEILLVSARTWRALNKQQQTWLQQAADESVPYMRKIWQQTRQQAYQAMLKAGVKFNDVANIKEWRDEAQRIYPAFLTTPHLKDLLAKIEAAQAEKP